MKKNIFSPAIIFILGILLPGIGNTFGIYMISDRIVLDKNGNTVIPMKEAMLNFITFGIYGIFWTYNTAEAIRAALSDSKKGFTLAVTVLSVLPFRCISLALIANKILHLERSFK